MAEPILSVDNLAVDFDSRAGTTRVLRDVSFSLQAGETLGIVGESGCGKSLTALALMGLIPRPHGRVASGEVRLQGENLLRLPERRMRRIRGRDIAMIFQEPMTSLNPVFTIGSQIAEAVRLHNDIPRREVRDRVVDVLRRVGIPAPERRMHDFPHQLSGGMRQRAMIAIALVCRPKVIIADEPTTALDVTVQVQILDLLREIQQDEGTAIILISHDMGVISQMSDRVMVMYAGRSVEQGDCVSVVTRSAHPYTRGLIGCIPDLEALRGFGRDDRLPLIEGVVLNLAALPPGCPFAPRCPIADAECRRWKVEPLRVAAGHRASCRKIDEAETT